jgi:multiple sugar transport system substrate-binding protein
LNRILRWSGTATIATLLLSSTALAQDAAWWKQAAAPYQGVTIRGVSESTPPSNYVAEVLGPKFAEATGIKVEFEATSWDQMYDKAIKDMEANTGIYDFVYIEQDIIYSYLARNFLTDITKSLADTPALAASDYKPENFTTFINYFKDPASGDVFGVPMEAFVKVYLYRKDLFDDPAVQKAYKDATGADLKPATTHEEYQQIAKFFAEWGKDKEIWGTTVQQPPAILRRSTSSSSPSRPPSVSTTGASTAKPTRRPSPMAVG